MSPAQPMDCVRRLPSQASVNTGKAPAGSEQQREECRAAHADEEIAPPAPVVAQSGEKQLAEGVGQNTQGAHRADVDERCGVADTVPTQLFGKQRRRHRQVGAAVITGGVAAEQQQQSSCLRQAQ